MAREMEKAVTRSAPHFARHCFAFASVADRESVLRKVAACLPSYNELELGATPALAPSLGGVSASSRVNEDIATFLRLSHPSVLTTVESVEANIAVGGGGGGRGEGGGADSWIEGDNLAHFEAVASCIAAECSGCEHCRIALRHLRHHGGWAAGSAGRVHHPLLPHNSRRRRLSQAGSIASGDGAPVGHHPHGAMRAGGIVRLPALPAKVLLWHILFKQYVNRTSMSVTLSRFAFVAITVYATLPIITRLGFQHLSGEWYYEPKTLALIAVSLPATVIIGWGTIMFILIGVLVRVCGQLRMHVLQPLSSTSVLFLDRIVGPNTAPGVRTGPRDSSGLNRTRRPPPPR